MTLCFQCDACGSFFYRRVWAGRVRARSRSELGPTLILDLGERKTLCAL